LAKRLLFHNVDIFAVTEHQKQELKAKFQQLSQRDLEAETLAARLVDEFSINVPTLSEAEKYATTCEKQIDVSRDPTRFIHDRSRPFYMPGTKITIHVPFQGDPGLFDVQPSTFNLNPPLGDISNHELLLIYEVVNPGAAISSEADRNLAQVRQHLEWLRPSGEQLQRGLEQLVQSLIAQRKQQISAHAQVVQSLGIPVRNAPDQQRPMGTQPVPIGEQAGQRRNGKVNKWDVFISHASEDKDAIARPLAQALQARGLRVWYDEFSLKVGDSLRKSIDQGLAHSEFGVVILSDHFFAKHWPTQELNGLATREVNRKKVILPVWHGVSFEQVREFSPTLADRVAVTTEKGVDHVVEQLLGAMK
jgi:hypothetical protein